METCHKLPTQSARVSGKSRNERGYTLVELGVTVSVAALLATLALPSFNGIIAGQRARTYASALYATLAKARSAAVTLNTNVTLQPKAGGWASGWQILDVNNNVLDDYTAAAGVTVNPAAPGLITYRSSGRLPAGAAPVFQITTGSGSTMSQQCVSVDLSGRPYMQAAATC